MTLKVLTDEPYKQNKLTLIKFSTVCNTSSAEEIRCIFDDI